MSGSFDYLSAAASGSGAEAFQRWALIGGNILDNQRIHINTRALFGVGNRGADDFLDDRCGFLGHEFQKIQTLSTGLPFTVSTSI